MKVLRLGQSLCSSNAPSGAAFENLYSLDFDGIDDYLTCGDSDVFTPNDSGADRGFSISFWVKVPALEGGAFISKSAFHSGGANRYEYDVRTQFAGKPRITFYGNDNSGITQSLLLDDVMSADAWHHLVFTFDLADASTSIIGYIDGVQKTNGSGATYSSAGTWAAVSNTAANLQLAHEGTGANYRNCKLDEFAIFDDKLSASTVTDIYNSGCPTDLSNQSYLLGYWRNGDTTGTAASPTITDDSSNSNNGTMTNMVLTDIIPETPCQTFSNLYSLDFDGVDDYVTFGDSNDFSFGDATSDTPFSVSAWINMSDATKFRILSKSSSTGTTNVEWILSTTGSDLLGIILYDNSTGNQINRFTASVASYENTWIQVCGTYDGGGDFSGINIYINGANANDSGAEAGTYVAMHSTSAPLDMGRFANASGTTYSDGNIDEVNLWNKELSAAEVTAIYNSGTPTDLSGESGLVGYWRNGDIQGTSSYPSLHDFSDNSNLGTMTNMASGDIVTDVP